MKACVGALALGLLAASAQAKDPADTDWPVYNHNFDGQRYSPLTEINAGNVTRLTPVCRLKIVDAGAFQSGPLVIKGMIYVTAATTTVALDATNCAEHWRSDYTPTGPVSVPVNRGAAFLDGRLFRGTVDGKLLALDAATGKVIWQQSVTDATKGESLTAAPIAWNGFVFIGTGGGDLGIKGRMMAFSAADGHEVWRFDTIPTGDQTGADSWETKDTALNGGGGTWSSYTLDPKTGELFIPVGNPAPALNPDFRPGKNLFTNSVVALEAKTGKLEWWYQVKSPDGVDHDVGAAPMLYRSGKGTEVVAVAGKDGYAYGIDRRTHKLLFKTAITTIKNEGRDPTPEGFDVCPGLSGGTKWNGPAFDPERNTVFVPATDWCNFLKVAKPEYSPGKPYWGGSFAFDQTPGSQTGWINALDADTGAIRWRYHTATVTGAAVTPTAGGVVFTGDAKGHFLVLDSKTGALLMEKQMTGPLAGGIVTYTHGGRQYVALTTGNISRSAAAEMVGIPTLVIMALSDGRQAVAVATQAAAPEEPLKPADPFHGRQIFEQSCISCHGADGTLIPDHSLKGIKNRMDAARLAEWIKEPKPPMPKLFPIPYGAQAVTDVAAYVSGF
jgi:alcohol dehydrogenase (cytochrome c)